jgi:hypothetical protein
MAPMAGLTDALTRRLDHGPVSRWTAKERRMFLDAVRPIIDLYARLG